MIYTVVEKTQMKRAIGQGIRYVLVMSNGTTEDAAWNSRLYVPKVEFDSFEVGQQINVHFRMPDVVVNA